MTAFVVKRFLAEIDRYDIYSMVDDITKAVVLTTTLDSKLSCLDVFGKIQKLSCDDYVELDSGSNVIIFVQSIDDSEQELADLVRAHSERKLLVECRSVSRS